jgi:fatty acid desaturase
MTLSKAERTNSMRRRLQPLFQRPPRPTGHAITSAIHLVVIVLCIVAWTTGYWPFCIMLWLVIAWMDHAVLARLHEAAHGMLVRSRLVNEMLGIAIGTLSLTPLSVYRYVHAKHHAYLGREQDPEFRPYNQPNSARWLRILYAWLELAFGWIFTPALYSIRTARAWPTLAHSLRRRLVFEWSVMVVAWSITLVVVTLTQTWSWFLVGHFVPAWLAGTLQTIRKFTEHLGKSGETIFDMTRTVRYVGPLGQAASRSQMNVDHHAIHHRWARIPYHKLPEATAIVAADQDRFDTFSNHFAAMWDMLPHLLDPTVGPQWKRSHQEQAAMR